MILLSSLISTSVLALCLFPNIKNHSTSSTGLNIAKQQKFIESFSKKENENSIALEKLLKKAHFNARVIRLIKKPAEQLPWYKYKKILINAKRINNGSKFYHQYQTWIKKAEQKFHVPGNIIVAIIGIESNYGQRMATFNSLDALSTLAFAYPKREKFFQQELWAYIKLLKRDNLNPQLVSGSYAGALGLPQFMPSNYIKLGINFHGNKTVDLLHDPIDSIGSVANFLSHHGWKDLHKPLTHKLPNARKIKPPTFLSLETTKNTFETWETSANFKVLLSYNNSPLYAMAVSELAMLIDKAIHKL